MEQNKIKKIDAKGKVLGRVATEVCDILRGKSNPGFVYNKICGDKVTVYNIDKIIVTGNKETDKKYYRHSKYLGSLKETTYQKMKEKHPTRALFLAIKGMLPKNRLQKLWLKNLSLINGEINKSGKV